MLPTLHHSTLHGTLLHSTLLYTLPLTDILHAACLPTGFSPGPAQLHVLAQEVPIEDQRSSRSKKQQTPSACKRDSWVQRAATVINDLIKAHSKRTTVNRTFVDECVEKAVLQLGVDTLSDFSFSDLPPSFDTNQKIYLPGQITAVQHFRCINKSWATSPLDVQMKLNDIWARFLPEPTSSRRSNARDTRLLRDTDANIAASWFNNTLVTYALHYLSPHMPPFQRINAKQNGASTL